MKIYKVYRTDRINWDEYDSFVVYAKSPKEALEILNNEYDPNHPYSDWPSHKTVKVKYLGIAKPGAKAGEILGSYNAG